MTVAPHPATAAYEAGTRIAGRYLVEDHAAGAMGVVYRVRDLETDLPMAVKVPRPEVLADRQGMAAILREAEAWIRLGLHPHIASCYYVLKLEGIPHIFIEYVNGGTLADWIATGRLRDLRTALAVAIQCCHGMEYTHRHGMVHRDIKPGNILLTREGMAKITDFGILLTRQVDEEGQETAAHAGSQPFRGTPAYAAPEQFQAADRVDGRADVFSFGVCLWLLFCGRRPYSSNRRPGPLPAPAAGDGRPLPASLQTILCRAVAADPAARYPDFGALRTDLNQVYEERFRFPCPFAETAAVDQRADSLNNRAVSLLQLGEEARAARYLDRALDANDMLEEAVYNRLLLHCRQGAAGEEALRLRLAGAARVAAHPQWFHDLAAALDTGGPWPAYRLCPPAHTTAVYREGQLRRAGRDNVASLLEQGDLAGAETALFQTWEHLHFRREPRLAALYQRLATTGRPGPCVGLVRAGFLGRTDTAVQDLALLPGSGRCLALLADGRLAVVDLAGNADVAPRIAATNARMLAGAGHLVAVADDDGQIILSRRNGRHQRYQCPQPVTALAVAGAGRPLVAAGLADGGILVLAAEGTTATPILVARIPAAGTGGCRSLALVPGRHRLAAGADDGCLRFWDLDQRRCYQETEAHALPVTLLAAADDGRRLVSAAGDRRIKVWDLESGRCLAEIHDLAAACNGLLLTPDHRYLTAGGDDDLLRVWEADSGTAVILREGRRDGITALAPGPAPHLLLAGGADGGIDLWLVLRRLTF